MLYYIATPIPKPVQSAGTASTTSTLNVPMDTRNITFLKAGSEVNQKCATPISEPAESEGITSTLNMLMDTANIAFLKAGSMICEFHSKLN